ncbi:MAG: hypothetical protein JWO47_380 [Candidatus Saccharibacteria bacterium]|nr:hypothetical protein [Candidatus Saccharibacteria bacterium]
MTNMFTSLKTFFKVQERDQRYVKVLIGSAIVFILCCIQVKNKFLFNGAERPVFEFFNNLPQALHGPMIIVTQFGSLFGLIFWLAVALRFINKRAAFTLLLTAVTAWLLDDLVKTMVSRDRPLLLLNGVHIFSGQTFSGFGFPSGHSTFVAACAVFLYYQLEPKYRKYLIAAILLVGISRMFLGAHFPSDVLGGWALGSFVAATSSLIFGMSKTPPANTKA